MNTTRSNLRLLRASMFLGVVGLLGSTSVSAQQMDPNMQMTMPMPAPAAAKKKPAAKKPDKIKAAPALVKKPAAVPTPAIQKVPPRTNRSAAGNAAAKTETMPADMPMDDAAMRVAA